MHEVVKMLSDFEGNPREEHEKCWHLVSHHGSGDSTFCQGEYLFGCEHERKIVKSGGITCSRCLEKIREIKAVKL